MSETKNMHYLSQMISRNFVEKNGGRTFLMYDPDTGRIAERNIKKLFSSHKPWGQQFEKTISGNAYENSIAPILKDLAACSIMKNTAVGPKGRTQAQFNAIILDEEKNKILSKLVYQTILLQRSSEQPDEQIEADLSKAFAAECKITSNLLLVEINPLGNYAPLVLLDGLVYVFMCPDAGPKAMGHACFMIPISEQRFLLWASVPSDYGYFCQKYCDIHYLNLCRIEQQHKRCKIALAKTPRNELYLKNLILRIPHFRSNIQPEIRLSRNWE